MSKESEQPNILFRAEHGSARPIRFLSPSQCKLYDSDGVEMRCVCGKEASILIQGKDSFIARCEACNEK